MDRNGTWKHTDSRTMSHREVRPTDLRPKKQRLHVTRPRTNHMAQSFHNKAKEQTPYHPIKSSVCDPGGEIYQPQATNRKQGLQVRQARDLTNVATLTTGDIDQLSPSSADLCPPGHSAVPSAPLPGSQPPRHLDRSRLKLKNKEVGGKRTRKWKNIQVEQTGQIHSDTSKNTSVAVRLESSRQGHFGRAEDEEWEDFTSGSEREQNRTLLFFPTSHKARPSRKLEDWHIRGKKPVLILGDSNLNRILEFMHPEVQIDSYPGANFYHFWKVVQKTPAHPSVKVVVFSVGLNNRDQDPQKTSIKQLRALYRASRVAFPNASIFFPLINYSPSLTQIQKQNLDTINTYITNYLPSLPRIPQDRFRTRADNIHWTTATAHSIFDLWCQKLSLNLQ
ncbi:uncharacterized protein LOC114843660 isoform X1 [Betta splendens]|uniref:Uncharacterized protein LOC114843660 isoform X1 n=1 Tax=Betta splendens TaxID=158456 RepID=A0A6P7KUW6_BETSP|nr:uncharacterized protein LOC114843660 isoform X1 [Betta splendens]